MLIDPGPELRVAPRVPRSPLRNTFESRGEEMIEKSNSRGRVAALTLLALSLAVLPSVAWAHPPDAPGIVETLVSFDASQLETPESLVFDQAGNVYISLALTGEIRRIAPDGMQSTFALIPIGAPLTPCGGFIAILGALTIDNQGNLYAAAAACDLANRGIWRISPDG